MLSLVLFYKSKKLGMETLATPLLSMVTEFLCLQEMEMLARTCTVMRDTVVGCSPYHQRVFRVVVRLQKQVDFLKHQPMISVHVIGNVERQYIRLHDYYSSFSKTQDAFQDPLGRRPLLLFPMKK